MPMAVANTAASRHSDLMDRMSATLATGPIQLRSGATLESEAPEHTSPGRNVLCRTWQADPCQVSAALTPPLPQGPAPKA
jgi:hypothetical protein